MDDLRLLLDELVVVCDRWYDLGLQLNLRHETLNEIRYIFQNHQSHHPSDKLLEMFRVWLTTSDNARWKTLTDALRNRSVRANQLAGRLARKNCLTKEMRESKQLTLAVMQ